MRSITDNEGVKLNLVSQFRVYFLFFAIQLIVYLERDVLHLTLLLSVQKLQISPFIFQLCTSFN